MGVIRPVIFVPDGWQDALPDRLPIEEEWDHQAWEAANQDRSQEHQKHSLPVSPRDCLGAGIAAGIIMWFTLTVLPVLVGVLLSVLSLSHYAFLENDELGNTAKSFLFTGVIGGALAPGIGKLLSNTRLRWIFTMLLFLSMLLSSRLW